AGHRRGAGADEGIGRGRAGRVVDRGSASGLAARRGLPQPAALNAVPPEDTPPRKNHGRQKPSGCERRRLYGERYDVHLGHYQLRRRHQGEAVNPYALPRRWDPRAWALVLLAALPALALAPGPPAPDAAAAPPPARAILRHGGA